MSRVVSFGSFGLHFWNLDGRFVCLSMSTAHKSVNFAIRSGSKTSLTGYEADGTVAECARSAFGYIYILSIYTIYNYSQHFVTFANRTLF